MSDIGQFGTAEEFNHLFAGTLVDPVIRPGLRSAMRVVAGPSGVPWSQTVMSLYPNITTVRVSGADWHTQAARNASVVVVPGSEPANVIFTFPRLIEAPVEPVPEFPGNISRKQWIEAGLDPEDQPPLWVYPDQLLTDARSNAYASEFEFYEHNGQRAARPKRYIGRGGPTYTSGIHIDPGADFYVIDTGFGLIIHADQLLPAGRYVFQQDAVLIPRSLEHDCAGQPSMAMCYRNQHLSDHPDLPRFRLETTAVVPDDLRIASISQVATIPGTGTVAISGDRLDRTRRVMFAPGIPGDFHIESDTLLRVSIPDEAEPGLLVVETTLGWVLTSFDDSARRRSRLHRPIVI